MTMNDRTEDWFESRFESRFESQFCSLHEKLNALLEGQETLLLQGVEIMADQAELDTALAALVSEVALAVEAILAKVPANIDLTAEVAAINQATTDLTNAVSPPA